MRYQAALRPVDGNLGSCLQKRKRQQGKFDVQRQAFRDIVAAMLALLTHFLLKDFTKEC